MIKNGIKDIIRDESVTGPKEMPKVVNIIVTMSLDSVWMLHWSTQNIPVIPAD